MLLFVALQNQIPTGGSSERAGTNKDQPSNCLLTAAKLSDYLDLTPRAVRKRLGSGVADGPAGGGGRSAMGWRWEVLPVDWQKQLEDISERKGFRSPQSMLAESQGSGWLPPVSFDRLPDRFKDEAMKWRDALLPVLRGQEGGVLGVDGAARGMEECRRVFGRSVSESTWRRHFDLAVERDANFEHWGRLDLYVAAEAFGHVSEGGGARGDRGDVGFLTDTISQIATPSHLTPEDRDAVFGALVVFSAIMFPLSGCGKSAAKTSTTTTTQSALGSQTTTAVKTTTTQAAANVAVSGADQTVSVSAPSGWNLNDLGLYPNAIIGVANDANSEYLIVTKKA